MQQKRPNVLPHMTDDAIGNFLITHLRRQQQRDLLTLPALFYRCIFFCFRIF